MERTLRKIAISVSVILFLVSGIPSASQTTFDLRYAQAQRYHAEGRHKEAMLVLEAALEGVGLSDGQRRKAQALMAQCRAEVASLVKACSQVTFLTDPGTADVSVDGVCMGVTPFVTELSPGRHMVKIEKAGYASADTVISVNKNDVLFKVALKPRFALLRLDVRPEEGNAFHAEPEVVLDGCPINLCDTASVFSEAERPLLYHRYKNDVLLVPEGYHTLKLTAEGFVCRTISFYVKEGDEKKITESLPVQKGIIACAGTASSDGAAVFVDGNFVGVLPLPAKSIAAGTHVVSFSKEGMKTPRERYVVQVKEGETSHVWADMKAAVRYKVRCDLPDAVMIVDGKEMGMLPSEIDLVEGVHRIMARKDGYYCREVKVDTRKNDGREVDLSLVPTKTVSFKTDRPSEKQKLSLYTSDGYVVSERQGLPCDVPVPVGIRHLRAVVFSDNPFFRSYVGPVNVKDKEAVVIRTFSKNYIQWLRADFSFCPENRMSCALSLLNFSPLPFAGLSTSLLKADFSGAKSFNFPALSCLLMNWDLRIGRSLTKDIDAGFVGSFAYYPNFFPTKSVETGCQWFAGAGVSSRIPYCNAEVKMGVEWFGENMSFVVKLGVSFSGEKTRGNCYLHF